MDRQDLSSPVLLRSQRLGWIALGLFLVYSSCAGLAQDCNRNGVPDTLDLEPNQFGFTTLQRFETSTTPRAVASGDFNADGFADLAIAARHGGQIAIYEGDVDGNMSPATPINQPNVAWVTAADLDGDGIDDIAATSTLSTEVLLFLSRDEGFEQRDFDAGADSAPDWITHGDLDGDDDVDLVFVRRRLGDIAILLNDGAGNFGAPQSLWFEGDLAAHPPLDVQLADRDGDGDLDLALSLGRRVDEGNAAHGGIAFFANDGRAGFSSPRLFNRQHQVDRLALGDIDGDGVEDDFAIVASTTSPVATSWVSAFVTTEESEFDEVSSTQSEVLPSVSVFTSVAIADLDDDDDGDIIALPLSPEGFSIPDGRPQIWLFEESRAVRQLATGAPRLGSWPRSLAVLEPEAANETGIVRLAVTAYSSIHGTNELLLLGSDEVPFSGDCNQNLVPDECELRFSSRDCDADGILDECQTGPEFDCDADGIPDACEVDCDDDGIPNDCDPDHGEVDVNFDGIDDRCPVSEMAFSFEGDSLLPPLYSGQTLRREYAVLCTQTTHDPRIEPLYAGLQGWSVAVVADGASIVSATEERTFAAEVTDDPPGMVNSGFRKIELTTGEGNEGVVQAIALSLTMPETLPIGRPNPLLRFDVEFENPEGAQLIFRDGLVGTGQPVSNVTTTREGTIAPVLHAKRIRFAPRVEGRLFRRGDTTNDGSVDLSDSISVLNYLFLGGPEPSCLDAADVDDSGTLDLSDGVGINVFLFLGGLFPPPPGPFVCGPDPSDDDLHCIESACSF